MLSQLCLHFFPFTFTPFSYSNHFTPGISAIHARSVEVAFQSCVRSSGLAKTNEFAYFAVFNSPTKYCLTGLFSSLGQQLGLNAIVPPNNYFLNAAYLIAFQAPQEWPAKKICLKGTPFELNFLTTSSVTSIRTSVERFFK